MNIEILWKPSTTIKPEELYKKHCRYKGLIPVIVFAYSKEDGYWYYSRQSDGKTCNPCPPEDIEYLDDSKEAVEALLVEFMEWIDKKEFPYKDGSFIQYNSAYCTDDINGEWLNVHISRIKALEDTK